MHTVTEILTFAPVPALATMSAAQIVMHIRTAQTHAIAREAIAAADRILAVKAVRS